MLKRIVATLFSPRSAKTIVFVFAWIAVAFYDQIVGPTLQDLQYRLKVDYGSIGRAIEGRSAGFFCGSIVGGILVDKLIRKYGYLMVGISLTISGCSLFVIPHLRHIGLLWFVLLVQGTASGVTNIVGQELVLTIWQGNAAGPIQLIHSGYGMGACLVPQIVSPFLGELRDISSANRTMNSSESWTNTDVHITTLSTTTHPNTTDGHVLEGSQIETAYTIIATVIVAYSLVFYILQFTVKIEPIKVTEIKKKTKWLDLIDPKTCAFGNRIYGFMVLALMSFYYFQAVGGQRTLGTFIYSYARDVMHMSITESTSLNTVMWIGFAIGRFGGFLLALGIPIRILWVAIAVLYLANAVILAIFSRTSPIVLWVFIQTMGLLQGPVYPAGIGWLNRYLLVTGISITVSVAGGSIGGIVYSAVGGDVMDLDPSNLMYLVVGCGILLVMAVAILQFLGSTYGDRFENEAKLEKKHSPIIDAENTTGTTYESAV